MTFGKTGIISLLLLAVLFSVWPIKIEAQATNAGFVPENIWYSKDPFEENDQIKIYTLIFNPDARELSGTVIFFDNNVLLSKKDFVAPAKAVRDISVNWTATAGEHKIFGKIENAKFLISKGKYEEVYLTENKTEESKRTVGKKIVAAAGATGTNNTALNSKIYNSGLESVKNIEKIVAENTPEFITKPIILTTETIEKLRSDAGLVSKNKKEEVQKEIKELNNAEIASVSKAKISGFLKPFKYVEFFFLAFFSFIFNNKLIFYSILVAVIFLILRYLWRLIFS